MRQLLSWIRVLWRKWAVTIEKGFHKHAWCADCRKNESHEIITNLANFISKPTRNFQKGTHMVMKVSTRLQTLLLLLLLKSSTLYIVQKISIKWWSTHDIIMLIKSHDAQSFHVIIQIRKSQTSHSTELLSSQDSSIWREGTFRCWKFSAPELNCAWWHLRNFRVFFVRNFFILSEMKTIFAQEFELCNLKEFRSSSSMEWKTSSKCCMKVKILLFSSTPFQQTVFGWNC